MVYVYPSTITTTTGHSTKYGTQNISNKAALCSNNTSLAYWGTKNPIWKGNYLRNYPDSVTTPSGSYSKPEIIYASGWTLNDVSNDAIVKKIVVEYKWEQIAYSSLTSFGNFDKPTISVIYKNKTLTSIKGAKPEAIRYNNNKTDKAKMNTNYAELATLHSHTIDVSKYSLTVKDLKNLKIKFDPAKNKATNHCRIVMQFLRLNVTYEKPTTVISSSVITPTVVQPLYQVTSKITPSESRVEKTWTYECTIKAQNNQIKPTKCTVKLDKNVIVRAYPSSYDVDTGVWTVNTFTNKTAKLTLECYSNTIGTKSITTTINKYADSINKSTTSSINILQNRIDLDIALVNEKKPYVFKLKDDEELTKSLTLTLKRDELPEDQSGNITLHTDNWLKDDGDLWLIQGEANIEHQGDGVWKITDITEDYLKITSVKKPFAQGIYDIEAKYTDSNKKSKTSKIQISILGNTLSKEFFKLRLEDGSDVRYNSLMITEGDDLIKPLTYTIVNDIQLDQYLMVKGEDKSVPVNEARYIDFTIELTGIEQTYYNVLTYIDIVDAETGENCSDILIATDSNIQLFQGNNNKYCVIDELIPNKEKRIKFVVQSGDEKVCNIKLKPFNYDNYDIADKDHQWKMGKIYFKEIPNLKMSITADKYDLNTNNNSEVIVTYTIENRSPTSFLMPINSNAAGYKFKITEPSSFKIKKFTLENENEERDYYLSYENENTYSPQFNEKNRIITLPHIQGATYNEANNELITHPYTLVVHYEATQKGIYDFKMCTEDNPLFIEDDQYKNCTKKQVLVNIDSNIKVKTFVTKQRPYINELIDFTIQFTNYVKPQSKVQFEILDIGSYDNANHNECHYKIEHISCKDSSFKESEDENILGIWTVEDVGVNETYELTLTLRPTEIGYHAIKTVLTDAYNNIYDYSNLVSVLERNKKMSFDVYHAVDPENKYDCNNCDMLTQICDEDYINLYDELYYVISITNNSKNPITDPTYVYARLPADLLENNVLCHTNDYAFDYDETTKMISFIIPNFKKCENKKICFKIQPTIQGTYTTNFMVTNRNAHVYHKSLTIHVNDDFNAHKMEHEITIYNFEKTNRYFRYELDGDNNIFKFFNQGNRPTKYVEAENYKQSSVEHYKGKNLKDLVAQISKNSKYVEPELLRVGNNKLKDKGYEIYPDGFIRRFGLLNSEVFHYSGQLPTVSNIVDRAMRWDKDSWDSKVWGGGIYENGVFDLSIDYSKIPTNFDILNVNNPIGKLQAIVDKAKPFGTQAVCYYNDTIDFTLKTDINTYNSETESIVPYSLFIPHLDLISLYNRHDNSIAAYYDMFHYKMKNDIDVKIHEEYPNPNYDDPDIINLKFEKKYYNDDDEITKIDTDLFAYVDVFDAPVHKKYISECLDIVQNMYDVNTYNNIDITKAYQYDGQPYEHEIHMQRNSQYTFEYMNEKDPLILNIDNDRYCISYVNDIMNAFVGFTIKKNDEIIFKRNFNTEIQQYHIQIETYQVNTSIEDNDENVIHFWIHATDKYYHIGYVIVNGLQNAVIFADNADTYEFINHDPQRRRGSDDNEEFVNQELIYFTVNNDIHNKNVQPKARLQGDGKYQWEDMGRYIIFQNNSDIDPECHNTYISSPILAFKYDGINVNNYDEITNVDVKLNATSNKDDFIKDLNINLYKDAQYYMPEDNVAKKTYYPKKINNIYEEYISTINIQQPNITICSHCLKTSLGAYDQCPYCGSEYVSHYNEKKAVTICYNCGYVVDGWHDYCTHCLSEDIEKTKVDYNKTYCNKCGNLEDDYYSHCPKCFSGDVIHLNKDEYKYVIQSDDTQNIDSIVIQTDTNRINVCNITLPFNINTAMIQEYEFLRLHIHGMNNNDGKFYYCNSCHNVGLGNVDKCEECEVNDIVNYEFDNVTMDIYVQKDNTYYRIDTDTEYDQLKGEFDIAIDVKDLADKNAGSDFKLLIYAENLLYDQINNAINNLNVDNDAKSFLRNNIMKMNIVVDNIYYESKYYYENSWKETNALTGINHTYIEYDGINDDETNYISFSNFNFDQQYDSLTLYLKGLNKSHSNLTMHLLILDKNDNVLYDNENINIDPDLFNYSEDLLSLVDHTKVSSIYKIKVGFKKITESINICLTDCHIVGEFKKYANTIDLSMNKYQYEIINNDDNYLIKNNDQFGLKHAMPYYIDGEQLKNGIVCLVDFGSLNANEYIRLYDIELLITYKNNYGQLVTDTINYDNKYTELFVNGNVIKNKGENWTTIKTSINILNNLESEVINNEDENSLTAIPLQKKLAQSFTLTENNLGTITLSYFGQIGSPSKNIIVELYNNYINQPNDLICSKNISLPNVVGEIVIEFNIDYLDNEQYWIVLKDEGADEYNYHRFKYNGNLGIGNLIHNDDQRDQNRVLCIAVDANVDIYESYTLPISIEDNIDTSFKIAEHLYRYNAQQYNTTSINDLSIQGGYRQYNEDEYPDIDDEDYTDTELEPIEYDFGDENDGTNN